MASATEPDESSDHVPVLCAHPDLEIELGLTGRVSAHRAKGCRQLLRLASPVLDALLDPSKGWREGTQSRLNLHDDDPWAASFFIHIVHYRVNRLPRTIYAHEVFKLGMFCDKYGCLELVKPFLWDCRFSIDCLSLYESKDFDALTKWVASCWILEWRTHFERAAQIWVRRIGSQAADFKSKDYAAPMEKVLNRLLRIRERTQRDMSHAADRLNLKCALGKTFGPDVRHCSALLVGSHSDNFDKYKSVESAFPPSEINYTAEKGDSLRRRGVYRSIKAWENIMCDAPCDTMATVTALVKGDANLIKRHQNCGWRVELAKVVDSICQRQITIIRDLAKELGEHESPVMRVDYKYLEHLEFNQ